MELTCNSLPTCCRCTNDTASILCICVCVQITSMYVRMYNCMHVCVCTYILCVHVQRGAITVKYIHLACECVHMNISTHNTSWKLRSLRTYVIAVVMHYNGDSRLFGMKILVKRNLSDYGASSSHSMCQSRCTAICMLCDASTTLTRLLCRCMFQLYRTLEVWSSRSVGRLSD